MGRQAVAPHCANQELAGPSLSHYHLSSVRGRRSKAFSADQRRLGIARTPPPRYTLRNQGDGWRPKAHCPRGALRLRRLIRCDAACELHAEHLILPSHHSPARVPLRHPFVPSATPPLPRPTPSPSPHAGRPSAAACSNGQAPVQVSRAERQADSDHHPTHLLAWTALCPPGSAQRPCMR